MIALDTNVIVRFLVRDDEKQAQVVYARFKQAESAREALFVPLLVVLETLWVLESAYEKSRKEILESFDELKNMSILEFEKDRVLQSFLSEGRKNVTAHVATVSQPFLADYGRDEGRAGMPDLLFARIFAPASDHLSSYEKTMPISQTC